MTTIRMSFVALLFTLSLAGPLWAQDSQPSAAGGQSQARYVDHYHGFGLIPPAGADRDNARTNTQLVSWSVRDANTGMVVCTLSVNKLVDKRGGNLDAFAKELAQVLTAKEGFAISSAKVVDLAARKAIDIRGTATLNKVQWWQRQVWVDLGKNVFLTLRFTGPAGTAKELEETSSAVLKTLELLDPAVALAQRQKNLQAGAMFLKGLTAEKVLAATYKEPQWFLVYVDDKAVGYACIIDTVKESAGVKGIETRAHVRYDGAKGFSVTAKLVSWFSPARDLEEATATTTTYQGPNEIDSSQVSITLSKGVLTRTAMVNGKPRVTEKKVPSEYYVPLGMVSMLERLVDRTKPATYAFASYAPPADKFDVHAVTVVGPEEIAVDSNKVKATLIEVRSAEDAAADSTWLDENGSIIRGKSSANMVTRPASREEVLKKYPTVAADLKD